MATHNFGKLNIFANFHKTLNRWFLTALDMNLRLKFKNSKWLIQYS